MPKTWVISDTHFQHQNIIQYCNRPFIDAEHQTEVLISNWNSVVSPEDTVIHCGDFILGQAENVIPLLKQLNGRIILTRGNHDTRTKLGLYSSAPEKIAVKDIHYETYKGLFFIFCHFPILDPDFAAMVRQDNSEVCWVHGHVHDKKQLFDKENHSFNVSADVTNFTPVLLDDLWRRCHEDFVEKGVWDNKKPKRIFN